MHRVFVYGTLKRGFPNFSLGMDDFCFLGRFRTVDPLPLVVGGQWNSPNLIDEPGRGFKVFGEVFEMEELGLKKIDRWEGVHTLNGYNRKKIPIECEDGSLSFIAWTYFKDRQLIDGIFSGPMEEYQLDPEYVIPAKRSGDFWDIGQN